MDGALRARMEARVLLQEYDAAHGSAAWVYGSVDVDAIATYLQLDVALFAPEDQPETTYGWLEPGESLIWLRPGLPEAVRRFTLAHELGHVRLHRRGSVDAHEPCCVDDLEEGEAVDYPGDELLATLAAYSPRSQREREANAFAAALLVPLDQLRARYLAGTRSPDALANAFGVSAVVIERQLELLLEMNLPPELAAPPHAVVPVGTASEPFRARAAGALIRNSGDKTAESGAILDEAQEQAVRAQAPTLVVAGPGAGKTATLARRIQYLVEQGIPPERILALTFSNKAAAEMRARLERLLGVDGLCLAVGTFHAFGAEVLRTYGPQVGLRPDFNLLDETDGYLLLQQLGAALPLEQYRHLAYPTLYFPDLLRAISRAKDELVTPEAYLAAAETLLQEATDAETQTAALKAREVARVYALYQQALQERGDADFGDLIMRTVWLLRDHPDICAALQQRYPTIVVDEFQDINRASGRLLQLLAGERRQVWVVGDSDQAIYRFRGASPANIHSFKEDYPEATVALLRRNYRSVPDIVALANAGRATLARMSGVEAAPPLEATRPAAGPAVTLATAPTWEAEMQGIAAAIARRVEGSAPLPADEPGPRRRGRRAASSVRSCCPEGTGKTGKAGGRWQYRDQVVLCRTREQARMVTRALQEAGIPVAAPVASLIEYDIVKDVLSLLLLLSEPSGMGLLRATTLPGYETPRADVEEVFRQAHERGEPAGTLFWRREFDRSRLSPAGAQALDRLADLLDRLQSARDPGAILLRYLFSESNWGHEALQGRIASGDIAAVRALLAHASRYRGMMAGRESAPPADEADHEDAEDETDPPLQPALPAGATRALREQRSSPRGLLEYLRTLYQLRQDTVRVLEDDGEGIPDVVRVMTIHASKGLEFPVVYLPNLAQGRFPAQHRGDAAPLPPTLGDGAIESQVETRPLEEMCLFYVAVTRAREELILSYAEQYGKRRYQPAEFISVVMRGLGERLRREEWNLTPQPPLPLGEGSKKAIPAINGRGMGHGRR